MPSSLNGNIKIPQIDPPPHMLSSQPAQTENY
jgi:hypothetical protein